MFEVTVNTRHAVVGTKELITTSSAGIQVQFTFSEDWDSLSKIAIFRNGDDANLIPVAVPNSNLVTIPAQSCSEDFVDEPLFVGVYGTDGLGAVIIPTVWTSLGVLRPGAVTTDIITPPEPTPDMWAQILAIANEAAAIADECEANEELRVAAEQLRAGAETARANAEALRAAAEDARAENENQRQGAETQRQAAEDARAQAEALRIQAEELRQANETSRASAESDRASAEQTRQTNEATRASNEAARVTTEQNRASAETQRASAESSRVTEETSRVSAESSRATAEQDRASAEIARASAESQRVTAENNRVSAEQNRVNAEDERVQAETDRAAEFANWEGTIASKVPNTRTVNGKALSTDITLDAGDIGYDPTETYQAGSVGAELSDLTRQLSDIEENQIPELKNAIDAKQDAPSSAGTAGQVLGLDSNLNPAWVDQTGGGGGMNIVTLTGTQITQVGADNTMYMCGELTELTFTAPAVGITGIRFTSGTTPTVLTISGVTAWMFDFDPTSLEASTTYEINVLNGVGCAGWA